MTRTESRNRFRLLAVASVVTLAVTLPSSRALAFDIVYDPSNYAQNMLTAARALQQINNQITALANQAQMLINQAKNLTSLPISMRSQIDGNFAKMTSLMGEAQKLAYNVQNIDRQFASTYQNFATDKTGAQLIESARQRWRDSLAAYEHSLKAGSVAIGNIQDTQSQTTSLVGASQSAVGILQATQAGNQLLAVQARQIADLTAMLAAQGRATALEKSREAAAEEQGRVQFSRFMTGSAYSATTVRMFHD